MKMIDLLGRTIGKLKVIEQHPERSNKKIRWICECECGRKIIAFGCSLNRLKGSPSCGMCDETRKLVTNIDCAYAAGLFDGEGSVMIWKPTAGKGRRHILMACITQTDKRPIDWIQDRWPGHVLLRAAKEGFNQKSAWFWQLSCRRAAEFLGDIRPYCVLKGERIDIGLKFQSTMLQVRERGTPLLTLDQATVEEREELRNQMMLLNKRGVA